MLGKTNRDAAVETLREALTQAPNPRVVGGPPAYWQWYDKVRTPALEVTED